MRREIKDNTGIIHAEKYLDIVNMQDFEDAVYFFIDKKVYNIVINCRELVFVDSMSIGKMIQFMQILKSRGGYLKFRDMNTNIRKIFEMVGAHKLFDIFSTSV